MALRDSPRFQTWGLLELLLERSWETCIRDPAGAEQLAHLGLLLSGLVDPSIYKVELIEDLRVRSWTYIGNACLLRSDLDGAAEAFETAATFFSVSPPIPEILIGQLRHNRYDPFEARHCEPRRIKTILAEASGILKNANRHDLCLTAILDDLLRIEDSERIGVVLTEVDPD